MLQKVAGKNIYGYEEFEMEFHPGVNVIIGKSDAGKSAAFRVIDWVRTNRPLGEGLVAEWAENAEGQIWTTDGNTIKRVKDKGVNTYQINNEKPLKAFGQNPPDSVLEILAIDDVNVQVQGETPFMLGKPLWSPGEVARVLNQAASLEDIDTSTRNLLKDVRTTERKIESDASVIKKQKQELKKYKNIPELEKAITQLEHLEKHRNTLASQRNTLNNLWQDIIYAKGRLKKTIDPDPIEKLLSKAEKINQERKKLQKESTELYELKREIFIVKERIKEVQAEEESLQKEYNDLVPDDCPLCGGPMK